MLVGYNFLHYISMSSPAVTYKDITCSNNMHGPTSTKKYPSVIEGNITSIMTNKVLNKIIVTTYGEFSH